MLAGRGIQRSWRARGPTAAANASRMRQVAILEPLPAPLEDASTDGLDDRQVVMWELVRAAFLFPPTFFLPPFWTYVRM